MFATLRLPLPLPWVLEVFIRLLHSSLLGIGLLAALAVAGLFVGTPAVDAATLVTDVAAHFRAEAPKAEPVVVAPPSLNAKMDAAADYIARRYRVSRSAIEDIVRTAEQSARAAGIDPLLVLALIGVESGYNPLSESVVGAQGLMQIIGKYHPEKFEPSPDGNALLDPDTNVRVGVGIIKEYIQRTGSLDNALQLYAGAADDSEFGYAGKVMAEKRRLEQAIRLKVKA